MNKLNAKMRVTEVDSLSDALVRLYKVDAGIAQDAFLKSVMADVETLSAKLTTAIRQDKVLSSLEDLDAVRDEAVKALGTLLDGYAAIPIPAKKRCGRKTSHGFCKVRKVDNDCKLRKRIFAYRKPFGRFFKGRCTGKYKGS